MFVCSLCGFDTADTRICNRCRAVLERIDTSCPRCARPLATVTTASMPCGACQKRPPSFARTVAPFKYAFPIDRAIHQLKFGRQLIYAPALAELLAPFVIRHLADCDGIVPVPLHRFRQWHRGFNQALEMGRYLARLTGIPLVPVARRIRPTRAQSSLPAAARAANVSGAFLVPGLPGCRRPLIVDDVITTGATADQLASALRNAGARTVALVAVARAA